MKNNPLVLLLLAIDVFGVPSSEAFSTSYYLKSNRHNRGSSSFTALHETSSTQQHPQQRQRPILVVGKIIVDEYGDPAKNEKPATVTVGGGAPQAAMGAALALAARDFILNKMNSDTTVMDHKTPPAQPVALLAAVGDLDFSTEEETSLREGILKDALQITPKLIRGPNLKTPRIRLWHDDEQVQQWYALNDSFGSEGAAGLWGAYPTCQDYEQVLESLRRYSSAGQADDNNDPILHIIVEGGASAPGQNGDSSPLFQSSIRKRISFLGVEPVTFPNEQGVIAEEDARHCAMLLQQILNVRRQEDDDGNSNENTVLISPDMALHLAMLKSNCLPKSPTNGNSWAVRDGPRGSILVDYLYNPEESLGGNDPLVCPTHETFIPAASLEKLINPTGAGNAYAAAITALSGSGMDPVKSACIANSVGAVFCEYNHCPPYTWEVVERIAQLSQDLQNQVTTEKTIVRRYGEEQRRLKECSN